MRPHLTWSPQASLPGECIEMGFSYPTIPRWAVFGFWVPLKLYKPHFRPMPSSNIWLLGFGLGCFMSKSATASIPVLLICRLIHCRPEGDIVSCIFGCEHSWEDTLKNRRMLSDMCSENIQSLHCIKRLWKQPSLLALNLMPSYGLSYKSGLSICLPMTLNCI